MAIETPISDRSYGFLTRTVWRAPAHDALGSYQETCSGVGV